MTCAPFTIVNFEVFAVSRDLMTFQTRASWIHVQEATTNRNALSVLACLCTAYLPEEKENGRRLPTVHELPALHLDQLSTRSTSHISSASSATTLLVVESTRSAVKTVQARRTAHKYSLYLSVASRNRVPTAGALGIMPDIFASAQHTARPPILLHP